MINFYKNCILCGDLDFYCLLCDEQFQHVSEVDRHIRWENHRKVIKTNSYVSKFKKDFIIKIGNLYYCDICNCVMSNINETSTHVSGETHVSNKGKPANSKCANADLKQIERYENFIKIFDNIAVSEKAWNGIVQKSCILCDAEIDNVDKHIKTSSHIIKLLQIKMHNKDNVAFKKINDKNDYCLTCNKTFPKNVFDTHIESQEHKNLFANCNIVKKYTDKPHQKKENININEMIFEAEVTINIMFHNAETDDNSVETKKQNCDFELEIDCEVLFKFDPVCYYQLCEKCDIALAYDSLEYDKESCEHIFEYKNIDHGLARAELARYGKRFNIKLNSGGSKGYCFVCDIYLSAHILCFEKHVNGKRHNGMLALKTKPTKFHKHNLGGINMRNFEKSAVYIKVLNVLWVNREFCIDKHSHEFLKLIDQKGFKKVIRCFICDVEIPEKDDVAHCRGNDHRTRILSTMFLTSFYKDFIREIKCGLFHCGYCNEVYPGVELLHRHIKSIKHGLVKGQKIQMSEFVDQISNLPDVAKELLLRFYLVVVSNK